MKPKNIKEFQALVERYETITLDEIMCNWNGGGINTAVELTGFGKDKYCKLCIAVGRNEYINLFDSNGCCEKCIYKGYNCNSGINRKTFVAIYNAETPQDLLNAFRARAKHLRKTYPQYLKS